MMKKKIIAFDCDSTLSAIEGIDELARLADAETFRQVEDLTNQAMNGEIAIEEIFTRRLELIRPTHAQCLEIGEKYLETIEPSAKETITYLQENGWECLIISGGFEACIRPLADHLGIEKVHAVPLHFDAEGNYQDFDESYPTARSGGKPEILEKIRAERNPDDLVMVGDGVSDLETQPVASHFIAYTGFVARSSVVENSQNAISNLLEIKELLKDH